MRLTEKDEQYVGGYCCVGNPDIEWKEKAYSKLGQLEDIEEELGIDLIILFKALSCGAYEIQKTGIINFDECKLLYKRIQIGSNVHWLSNYGKTWSLNKEDLV